MTNYRTTGGIKFSYSFNNETPDLEEAKLRGAAYKSFNERLINKFRDDMTINQSSSLTEIITSLTADYMYGRLNVDFEEVLNLNTVAEVINELTQIQKTVFAEKNKAKSQGK
ncbi:MAG: hypothetical protein J5779_02850 [Clostridia bacterium]|nr:hypothetical protein [Clostridia bacterium]